MSARKINHITLRSDKILEPLTLAVVSDLHNAPFDDVLPELAQADGILIPGDLVNRHRRGYEHAVRFLQEAPKLAPTYYAIGNHEWKFPQRDAYWPLVLKSSAVVLDNTYTLFRGIMLGALSSAPKDAVNAAFLGDMEAQPGFRLLMCHHPEMYEKYVQPHQIDLTLAGHAHGGQVQVFGQGLFAPGQGIFPRLTAGWYHDGKLLVSRGMTNSARAPRWGNPCEMIMLLLKGMNDE